MSDIEGYTIKEMVSELKQEVKENHQNIVSRLDTFNDLQKEANHRTTKLETWALSAQDMIDRNTEASSVNTFSRAKVIGAISVFVFLIGSLGALIRYSVKQSVDGWIQEGLAERESLIDDKIAELEDKIITNQKL